MFDFVGQGREVESSILINHFAEDDISQIISESAFLEVSDHNREKVIDDCIQRLKNERLRLKRQHLHNQIKTAQASGDEIKLSSLIEEFHHLIKKRE
jgi:hypothetical protein